MKIKKVFNLETVSKRIAKLGLNQSRIAEELNVSREAVSKWFNLENQPSAGKLLKLSKLLQLTFDEILSYEVQAIPIVNYRKNANAKTSKEDEEFAKEMGNTLEILVPYFQNEKLTKPPILQNPINDYDYINIIIENLKNDLSLNKEKLSVEEILSIFYKFNCIIIPVLWKENKRHANALRIYLQESLTTWIYLNLNTKIYDFKFWIAHELGHVLAHDLKGDEAESFANNFAGAFLFPQNQVKELYNKLLNETNERNQIDLIIEKGKELFISPLSVYMQICAFIEHYNLSEIKLKHLIYKFNSKFNSYFHTVSFEYFKTEYPSANVYIDFVTKKLNSHFFDYLKKYIQDKSPTPGFIQNLLDVSFLDAQNIYDAL